MWDPGNSFHEVMLPKYFMHMSVKECLNKIRPYLSYMINDLKKQGE